MARRSLLILPCILLCQLAAHAESAKDVLNHQYKKHVVVLRAPFTSGDQKFDSNGQSLNSAPKDAWLTYGGIFVEKISLTSSSLRMQGHRVGFGQDKNKKQTMISLGKSVRVEIQLAQPLKTAEELHAVLERIFIAEDGIARAQPMYRRADDTIPAEDTIPKEEIYRVQDGAKPPRALYTPEPEYSENARKRRFQGVVVLYVVVDKTGRISRIRLERASGYGLDEKAMEGVKAWRFDPATRNGEPVAVAMNIEVAFNLY